MRHVPRAGDGRGQACTAAYADMQTSVVGTTARPRRSEAVRRPEDAPEVGPLMLGCLAHLGRRWMVAQAGAPWRGKVHQSCAPWDRPWDREWFKRAAHCGPRRWTTPALRPTPQTTNPPWWRGIRSVLAEREGFEPSMDETAHTGFRDRRNRSESPVATGPSVSGERKRERKVIRLPPATADSESRYRLVPLLLFRCPREARGCIARG